MSRRKPADPPVEDAISKLRRQKRNYGESDERVLSDAIERVRSALSPLSTSERRRAIVAIAALFGDLALVRAIVGTARIERQSAKDSSIAVLEVPQGVSL